MVIVATSPSRRARRRRSFPADARDRRIPRRTRTDGRGRPARRGPTPMPTLRSRRHRLDLSTLSPRVALPHSPTDVVPIERRRRHAGAHGVPRHLHRRTRARFSRGARGARARAAGVSRPGVQLVVTPASREVLRTLRRRRHAREVRGDRRDRHHARLRRVLRHERRDSRRRDERALHGEPELQGAHGQRDRVDLPRVAGGVRARRR